MRKKRASDAYFLQRGIVLVACCFLDSRNELLGSLIIFPVTSGVTWFVFGLETRGLPWPGKSCLMNDWAMNVTQLSLINQANSCLLKPTAKCSRRRQWHPNSSTLAWKIPWMEELGGLQSMGVAESRTRLSDFTFTFMHWRRKWQPTPVFLPGESQGRGSLVGCRLWGCTESDTTEAT